jgi:hypothetical protein
MQGVCAHFFWGKSGVLSHEAFMFVGGRCEAPGKAQAKGARQALAATSIVCRIVVSSIV